MKYIKEYPSLREIFSHLLLFRLFIPLIMVGVIAIVVMGYIGKQNLVNGQNQVAQSMSHIVDYHIDHGERILDVIARVAEVLGTENLQIFMKSTLQSYGYFETIYCLNRDNKITLMTFWWRVYGR